MLLLAAAGAVALVALYFLLAFVLGDCDLVRALAPYVCGARVVPTM
jgi:hypothetical protein